MPSSSAPPFKVPGHDWDPVKKRFFKSNPGGDGSSAPPTSKSSSAAKVSRVRDARSQGHSIEVERWRAEAQRAREALRARLGIRAGASGANVAGSMADLRLTGRLTLQGAGRLGNPAREVASRLTLQNRFTLPLGDVVSIDTTINRLAYDPHTATLYASSAVSTYRIDRCPDENLWGSRGEPRYGRIWHKGPITPDDVEGSGERLYRGLKGHTHVAIRSGWQVHVVFQRIPMVLIDGLSRGLHSRPLVITNYKVAGDLFASAIKEVPTERDSADVEVRLVCGLGQTIVVGRILSPRTFESTQVLQAGSDVMCVCFSSDTRVYAGLRSGRVVRCSVDGRRSEPARFQLEDIVQSSGSVTHVEAVGETEMVIAWTTGEMILLDTTTNQTTIKFAGHVNSYTFELPLSINITHRLLVLLGQDDIIRLWSLDAVDPLLSSSSSSFSFSLPLLGHKWKEKVSALVWTRRYEDVLISRQDEYVSHRGTETERKREGGMDGPPALVVVAGKELWVFE